MKIGFIELLTILFAGAKLFGAVTWSWWWVFSPMLIGYPVILVVVILAAIIAAAK